MPGSHLVVVLLELWKLWDMRTNAPLDADSWVYVLSVFVFHILCFLSCRCEELPVSYALITEISVQEYGVGGGGNKQLYTSLNYGLNEHSPLTAVAISCLVRERESCTVHTHLDAVGSDCGTTCKYSLSKLFSLSS